MKERNRQNPESGKAISLLERSAEMHVKIDIGTGGQGARLCASYRRFAHC